MSLLDNVGSIGLFGDMLGMESLRADSALDVFELRPPLRPPRVLLPRRDLLPLLESIEPGVPVVPTELIAGEAAGPAAPPPPPRCRPGRHFSTLLTRRLMAVITFSTRVS